MRRLAGLKEAVAAGFTAVTTYIDGERVRIGDPDWVKMTDDIEGTVEELKNKYRGAKVTVKSTGEQEVSIEVERKKGSRLSERAAGGSPSRNTEGEFKVGDKVVYFDGKDQIEGTIVGVRSSGGYYVKDRYRTTFSADERDLIPTAKFKGEERLSERAAGGSRGWESVSGVPTPVKVYDNGGETADRYTVVLDEPGTRRGGDFTALGLSDNPGHPQGFSQFTTAQDGPHLGKRIKFADLPDEVRKHAANRLKTADESSGGRRLAGLNERATEHWSVIAYDNNETKMDVLRGELEKNDIEAEIEPVMTARGERYDLLVPQSKEAEANKILAAYHGRGLSRNRSYKLPNVPEESAFGEATPAASDLDHDIEREIGRWLESGEEFELGDINEPVDFAPTSPAERRVLEKNVLFIVLRELEKKVGKLAPRTVTVEILRGAVESEKDDDNYRAIASFRIWHAGDSYAQGSLTAEGTAGELQNMTINITQASGHGKKNTPLRFF